MTENNEQLDIFGYILLRTQLQRFTPRTRKSTVQVEAKPSDPIFHEYRIGRVSGSELCRHFGKPDDVLHRLLVEKGELFGD